MRIALLLLAVSGIALGQRHTDTAEEVLSYCAGVSAAKVTSDGPILPQDFETGRCWGAFATLYRLSKLFPQGSAEAFVPICSPLEATTTQYVAIFVQYARANPRRLHEEFLPFAIESLAKAFPCSAKIDKVKR
jgi:hypothetical protein